MNLIIQSVKDNFKNVIILSLISLAFSSFISYSYLMNQEKSHYAKETGVGVCVSLSGIEGSSMSYVECSDYSANHISYAKLPWGGECSGASFVSHIHPYTGYKDNYYYCLKPYSIE